MELIKIRNANEGVPELLDRISRVGITRNSRDGEVIMFPEPCTIVYEKPQERVVFWAERDANPFFHLTEALWMLSARRDVKYVAQYVSRMSQYSDDGKTFHGAYGYRWRKNFKQDQLIPIIETLKGNPDSRRNVLGIWDVKKDLAKEGRDFPCNVSATFQINNSGSLDMVVHNRSNDGILGALGANCVHFSILQEYIAQGVGVPIGRYWQVSSNMHVYKRDFERFKGLVIHAKDPYRKEARCPYEQGEVLPTQVVDTDILSWESDLYWWMRNPIKWQHRINSPFFKRVATPMYSAHKAYKKGQIDIALEVISTQMPDKCDWKMASLDWLYRRKKI